MRRIASVALAVLLALPLVGPAAAAVPTVPPTGEPVATPAAEPTAEPTPNVEPAPSAQRTPTPTAEPTSATPTTDPPTAEPSRSAVPTDPTVEPRPTVEPATDAEGRPIAKGRYIVMLSAAADTAKVLTRHRQRDGIRADRRYDRAFRGFTARLDQEQRQALLADPSVLAVVPDEVIELAGQVNPTGVSRVGARQTSVAGIDNIDERVDADVAVVDTGVGPHPDLNVVGGVNCSSSDRTAWADQHGHGTHVAGTVGAIDNTFGVVGVAPGARIWAVRILNKDGYGLLSWYVCGLDWVLAQRDPFDANRPLIEAVNMSVAKSGADDLKCGTVNKDVLHQAICRLYAAGVTVVAAAANEKRSASNYVPAAYNEVITVSALADTDGVAGGRGGNLCYSWGGYDKDDTFADFSNYGSDVDLIAPGKCIWSTRPGPTYGYSSGTSMAAPAVAGAVALYKSSRPLATPAEVRESLRYLGSYRWATSTDPDRIHEPLLNVARVARLGTFSVSTGGTVRVSSAGGTASVPVTVVRGSGFFERVRLSVQDVPAGWTATMGVGSLYGWTGTATAAQIKVPPSATPGIYHFKVVGTNWGRIRSATATVEISGEIPVARAPIAAAATNTSLGMASSGALTISLRVLWPAATDPSDAIVGYQVQRNVNGGAWSSAVTTSASNRQVIFGGLSTTASHGFRVRARDSDGDWSTWAQTSTAYRLAPIGDRWTSMIYRGTWTKSNSSSSTNGTLTSSSRNGATVRHTFTGRGVAVVAFTNSFRGKAALYVDGAYRGLIDTRTSTARYRRVVFQASWGTSGTHTIQLRVLGTSGRPTVSIDGLVIIR